MRISTDERAELERVAGLRGCVELGRFRGGLSTKIHHAVDGKGRPLVILGGPGRPRAA